MKNAEPIDTVASHPPAPDARPGKRTRQEEARILSLRRLLDEPDQDGEARPCAAPVAGIEPPIGTERMAPAVPIGVAGAAALGPRAGQDLLLEGADEREERIVGSGDRMHHLALAGGTAIVVFRLARAGKRPETLVLPARPKSRAECRRRCGKGGFCDPASDIGCGGEYCDNATAAAREKL